MVIIDTRSTPRLTSDRVVSTQMAPSGSRQKALGRAGQSGGAGACLPDLPREAAVLRSISFQETMAWLSLMHLPDSAN